MKSSLEGITLVSFWFLAAVFFGIWQESIPAAIFMAMTLALLAK